MRSLRHGSLVLACLTGCVFEPAEHYPPDEALALSLCPICVGDACEVDECDEPAFTANGVDQARIVVRFPEGSGPDQKVALTTSLGAFDRGKPEGLRGSTELVTSGVQDVSAILYAGIDSGEAVVRATVGGVFVERLVTIAPATPTSLDILGNVQVLAAGAPTTNLSVYLYNERAPRAAVSAGLDVHLHTCSARGHVADVPRLVRTAAPSTGSVTATLTLNAVGAALVNEVGPPDALDEPLFVHAYVVGAGETPPQLAEGDACANVEAALAGLSTRVVAQFVLRRKTS